MHRDHGLCQQAWIIQAFGWICGISVVMVLLLPYDAMPDLAWQKLLALPCWTVQHRWKLTDSVLLVSGWHRLKVTH